MEVRELPHLKFGPVQTATFAPLLPVIEEFAYQHALRLSSAFDGNDSHDPHCCYFVSWPQENRRHWFVRICSRELFIVGTTFRVGASSSLKRHQRWNYTTEEGRERLRQTLEEARLFLEQSESS